MAGAGIKAGTVVGASDELGYRVAESPYHMRDLHATIFHALGISPKQAYEIEKRPFYVTRDGLGKPVTEILREA